MNYQKDNNGTVFTTPHGQAPAFANQPVTVYTSNGPVQGTWNGSNVVTNK